MTATTREDTPRPNAGVRALLTDGRVVLIRPLTPEDAAATRLLHECLDARDRYLRFFTGAPGELTGIVHRIVRAPDAHHAALGAFLGQRLVGVAHYEVLLAPTTAEVAFAVDRSAQAHGVGTLLLEHLVSWAVRRGVREFVAEVLTANTLMLKVFADSGLALRTTRDDGVVHVQLALDGDERYLAAVGERERVADIASLTAVLRPRRIAVVGAGRLPSSVGHALLRNLRDGGYTGTLTAVNPHAREVAGVPCVAAVADLPEVPDLAVLCVPAAAVPEVAEACGRRGVPALLVVSAGLTGTDDADRLREVVRRHGMRLVGPNCLGVVNTDSATRMNATFARGSVPAGTVGVVTQSGGVGIALLDALGHLGLGVSTLVSTGDKYDVSGNDLLLWWKQDPATRAAVLYLESFGNPRKFGRLARGLARSTPVVSVRTGSTDVARRAAASHTAAAATPAVTRDALFEQAGVIAVDTLADLVDVLAVLSWQPMPAGRRVAVVSNAGGAGVLAADACVRHGLTLPELSAATTSRLEALLPAHASRHNPVDTTATVDEQTFGACLEAVLADGGVDAVIAATVPTALGDPISAVTGRVRTRGKPVLAVQLGQLPTVTALPSADGATTTPSYADPAAAGGALGRVARYAAWRSRPAGTIPDFADLDVPAAVEVLRGRLERGPAGGWLDPGEVTRLLRCFGIPVVDTRTAADEQAAVAAFAEVGGPVAVKAVAEGVLHKTVSGGVLLNVADEDAVRRAVRTLRERFGAALRGVVVQPMAEPGRELLVGVSTDPVFGPLVVFGLGGVDTDLIADRAARLTPLTDRDAEQLVHGLRASTALFGPDARPPLDAAAVADVLLRVGRLADVLPEVAELDVNPLVVGQDGAVVVDARVCVRPRQVSDPFLRGLRG